MDVDTGQFAALTDEVDRLRTELAHMEAFTGVMVKLVGGLAAERNALAAAAEEKAAGRRHRARAAAHLRPVRGEP
jgi:hypothetical protein